MDLEQQLNVTTDRPPSQRVLEYLMAEGGDPEDLLLHHRFVWGVRQGQSPRDALQLARLAYALHPRDEGSLADGWRHLDDAIGREVTILAPGEHRQLDDDGQLLVANLHREPVHLAQMDCRIAWQECHAGRPLTIVIEEPGTPGSSRSTDGRTVWTVPVDGDPMDTWARLLGESAETSAWIQAVAPYRQVCSRAPLAHEHATQATRFKALLHEMLQLYAHGESATEATPISSEEAASVVELADQCAVRYVTQPRLVLPCRDLVDLRPADHWQEEGPRALAALLDGVVGDDPLTHDLFRHADSLRFGAIALTGDPDQLGDDLLSATLPFHTCSLILRPDALDRTVLFRGVPRPFHHIAVPERRFGTYSTVGLRHHLVDLLRARIFLALTPTTSESQRLLWTGQQQTLDLLDTDPPRPFIALLGAIAAQRALGPQGDLGPVRKAASAAVGLALHQALAQPDRHESIGAVHVGSLAMADIEQVVVAVTSPHEFVRYVATGRYPEYLRPAYTYFERQGILLRLRPPESKERPA